MSPDLDVARLIQKHQAGVWRYLRVLGADSALAEDLTQETFLLVLQRPFRQYSTAATAAYLRTVARHLYLAVVRREARQVSLEVLDQLDERWQKLAGRDGGTDLLGRLEACVARLDERSRQVLEMRYRQGLSREAMATELSLSPDGVKNLLQRAKQKLRACLEAGQKDNA